MDKPEIAGLAPAALELEPGTYYWCACGKSKNQPFCDGSHQGTSFTPKPFKVEEKGKFYVCNCKNSKNAPFCDGTHNKL